MLVGLTQSSSSSWQQHRHNPAEPALRAREQRRGRFEHQGTNQIAVRFMAVWFMAVLTDLQHGFVLAPPAVFPLYILEYVNLEVMPQSVSLSQAKHSSDFTLILWWNLSELSHSKGPYFSAPFLSMWFSGYPRICLLSKNHISCIVSCAGIQIPELICRNAQCCCSAGIRKQQQQNPQTA